ncbi:UDPglucose 6-dehydrogenase [Paenibacillus sp. 1_12]|uniref:UDP-glucose dehydrogenase family protein n=1 Tax=Paenibacillus sp. 1_12 TaxID=1566278 RepID=UPI0008E9E87B|nr:nucleotide sugar dehydrogenase [Paenibacillus sp. 1_12]SFL80494.1 UDPglucose 6-dehydrogenase [Paenibacillus sp. 1_12]
MIAVIGLGFVGLTTGLGLAHRTGQPVFAYDADEYKRELYKSKQIPFYEPQLQEHLELYEGNRFIVCDTMVETVAQADIIFICVGTPSSSSGETDLGDLRRAVIACLDALAQLSQPQHYPVFVIKSTVPASTTTDVIQPLLQGRGYRIGENIGLASNPEFLREGSAWHDFVQPDRIIIGELDPIGAQRLKELYVNFGVPIHCVSAHTAEFVKYASNALLATMISFANELSMIAKRIGSINIPQVFHLLHEDKRWQGHPAKMTDYVFPGCGFGGYCLPKDTLSLYAHAEQYGHEAVMLKAVLQVNEDIKSHIVEQIAAAVLPEETIGILGLSFKPESDDVRGAVSRDIIGLLLKRGYSRIVAYDPLAMDNFRSAYGLPIEYADSVEEVVERSQVITIITAWRDFKDKKNLYNGKKIIDGRHFL